MSSVVVVVVSAVVSGSSADFVVVASFVELDDVEVEAELSVDGDETATDRCS